VSTDTLALRQATTAPHTDPVRDHDHRVTDRTLDVTWTTKRESVQGLSGSQTEKTRESCLVGDKEAFPCDAVLLADSVDASTR